LTTVSINRPVIPVRERYSERKLLWERNFFQKGFLIVGELIKDGNRLPLRSQSIYKIEKLGNSSDYQGDLTASYQVSTSQNEH
jgi:hypothetical protein